MDVNNNIYVHALNIRVCINERESPAGLNETNEILRVNNNCA